MALDPAPLQDLAAPPPEPPAPPAPPSPPPPPPPPHPPPPCGPRRNRATAKAPIVPTAVNQEAGLFTGGRPRIGDPRPQAELLPRFADFFVHQRATLPEIGPIGSRLARVLQKSSKAHRRSLRGRLWHL